MFHYFFVNTRSSIERIHKQLRLLGLSISLSTQVLFIGYYAYLIYINVFKTAFLVTYISLLVLSLFVLFVDLFFIFNKGRSRLEKRLNLEKKRRWKYVFLVLRIILKLAVIIISGIELMSYPASDMQIITLTLSIVLFIFYIAFNSLIFIINKDIDLIRLSIESDISSSKILSKLTKEEKVYTEQEHHLIDDIKDKARDFLSRRK